MEYKILDKFYIRGGVIVCGKGMDAKMCPGLESLLCHMTVCFCKLLHSSELKSSSTEEDHNASSIGLCDN